MVGGAQVLLLVLARGLGLRLRRNAVLTSFVVAAVILAPWLFGSRVLVPCDILQGQIPGTEVVEVPDTHGLLSDAVYQFLPWEFEIRRAFEERRVPLWSDRLEGGSSPWINPQAGVLSVIATLARVLPIRHWLLGSLLLKMVIGFQGMWLLNRLLGSGRFAAVVAATCFSTGGAIIAWALFPHSRAMAWVPWLVVAVIRLMRRPHLRTLIVTAVITAFLALAGHPEIAAIGGVLAAVCGLYLRSMRVPLASSLGHAAAAATLGLGLAAPHVLPFIIALPHTSRAHDAMAVEIAPQDIRLSDPRTWFLGHAEGDLVAPLNPEVFGRPFTDSYSGPSNWAESGAGYTGLLMLAGTSVLLFCGVPARWRLFGVLAAVCLLMSAHFLPFVYVIETLPFKAIALRRFLLVASFCLCVLGAAGVDRISAGRRRRSLWVALAAVAGLSIVVAPRPRVILVWLLLVAAAALARRSRSWAMPVLVVAVAIDLMPWARSMMPRGHAELFYPRTESMDWLANEAGSGSEWRVVGQGYTLFPSLLPVYGIADVRPHNPLAPWQQTRILEAVFDFGGTYMPPFRRVDHPLLDFLGVRFVVSRRPQQLPSHFDRVFFDRVARVHVYRNNRALPRFFAAGGVDVIREDEILAWLTRVEDPRRVAVFVGEASEISNMELMLNAESEIYRVTGLPGRVTLRVTGNMGCFLVTSLPFPQGWTAQVDGHRLKRLTVNGCFFGARIPAGANQVELRFLPPGFALGTCLFAIALAVIVFLLWFGGADRHASLSRRRLAGSRAE
jgi:hypothetical protein